jgi:parallel beta-helix repeat protein
MTLRAAPGAHVLLDGSASSSPIGLTVTGNSVRVTGVTFSHYSEGGIKLEYGSGDEVDHDTAEYNGVSGIQVNAASGAIVKDNLVTYNGQVGIVGNSATNVNIDSNNVSFNNQGDSALDGGASGIKVTQMVNVTIRGNWVAHNKSNGIWVDVSSTNSDIISNQVLGNEGNALQIEVSSGAIIAGNIVYGNTGNATYISFTKGVTLANNTFVNNAIQVDVSAWESRPADPLGSEVVINNLLWGGTAAIQSNLYNYDGCSGLFTEVDYNGYYRPTGSPAVTQVNYCNDMFTTMGAFHTGTGFEAHGLAVSGGSDPWFVDAADNNFHLRVALPGQVLPSAVAQALGWTVGAPVSRGAEQ